MRRLPLVYRCGQDFDAMPREDGRGRGSRRHCASCATAVHDLSAGTEAEALGLLLLHGARGLCVRFTVDARDQIEFRAPPPTRRTTAGGLAPRRAQPLLAAAALGVAAVAAAGCGARAPEQASGGGAQAPASVAPVATPAAAAPSGGEATAAASPAGAEPDRDGNSIADAQDACPDERGQPHQDPSRNGCPTFVGVMEPHLVIHDRIAFERNGARLSRQVGPIVEAVAAAMLGNPQICRVAIRGHASADERDAARLSQARAQAIAQRLIARGVDAARLQVEGRGSAAPLSTETTAAVRAQNRRVDFEILEQGSPCAAPSSPSTAPSATPSAAPSCTPSTTPPGTP